MAKDPVCEIEVNEKEAVATYEYKGKTYYFCAVGCKEKFAQNPENFSKKTKNNSVALGTRKEVINMKKWISILVALSLVLAFSMPVYAQQKAKPAPMSKEEADKMMEECVKMMDSTMAKMKEMHEKMHKGEMKVDAAKMKKLRNSIFTVDKALEEVQMKGY